MRTDRKYLALILVGSLLLYACAYIVLPEEVEQMRSRASGNWTAVATGVGKSDAGNLHIDITIRNETGDWSAMHAVEDKPAVLTTGSGSTNCDTVFVGTGGHRLAPGFQMRGYTGGTKAEPQIQPLYVECPYAEVTPGSKLAMDIVYYTGELNYFDQEANKVEAKLEIDLSQVTTDLVYPVAQSVEGLILPSDAEIPAINDNVLTLVNAERTDEGLQFTWRNYNPTKYPLRVHIGTPPVIGEDGIIYGVFEIMDLVSPPITPAGESMDWTTAVAVPQDVTGFYILLSVESRQQRLYVNYAIDISDK